MRIFTGTIPDYATDVKGLLLGGVPFGQASQAERLRCALAIAMRQSPRLRDVWVRDGALLVYSGRVVSDYESCARAADAPVRATVTQYTVGEGDCADTCGHVPDNAPDGSPARMQGVRRATNLYAPASGIDQDRGRQQSQGAHDDAR